MIISVMVDLCYESNFGYKDIRIFQFSKKARLGYTLSLIFLFQQEEERVLVVVATITSPVVVVRVSDRAIKRIVVDSYDVCGADNLEIVIDALLAACRTSARPNDDQLIACVAKSVGIGVCKSVHSSDSESMVKMIVL